LWIVVELGPKLAEGREVAPGKLFEAFARSLPYEAHDEK
jgi:hypothetical protein